jgi:hypothetical protein
MSFVTTDPSPHLFAQRGRRGRGRCKNHVARCAEHQARGVRGGVGVGVGQAGRCGMGNCRTSVTPLAALPTSYQLLPTAWRLRIRGPQQPPGLTKESNALVVFLAKPGSCCKCYYTTGACWCYAHGVLTAGLTWEWGLGVGVGWERGGVGVGGGRAMHVSEKM